MPEPEFTEQEFALAAETCERQAVRLQGFDVASKILRSIGSLKGMTASLKKQIADLSKERTAEQANLEQVKLTAKEAAKGSASQIAEAERRATSLVEKAKADAKAIVDAAGEQAALDLANARAQLDGKLKGLTLKIAEAEKKLKDVEDKNAKANEAAASVEARAKEAQAKLEKVLAAAKSITA